MGGKNRGSVIDLPFHSEVAPCRPPSLLTWSRNHKNNHKTESKSQSQTLDHDPGFYRLKASLGRQPDSPHSLRTPSTRLKSGQREIQRLQRQLEQIMRKCKRVNRKVATDFLRSQRTRSPGTMAVFRWQKRFPGGVWNGEIQWMRKERKRMLRKPKKRKEGIIYSFILKNINALLALKTKKTNWLLKFICVLKN